MAEKNGVRYGIQAKCYSNIVSNSAIQEVVAGISFYKCDKAIVITNNHFTSSAIELARANEVVLWDREMLKQKIGDLFS
ncbi:restriction endonuclease [Clostridium muellerianum]|uniref:restriction endonuclease n=1 Tax=Clostridium muellerianum TaxID=2716538 RepID=UPI00315AFF40